MRITKLPAGDTVFGQPIEKGYSILSSENNFYLYLTSFDQGPAECVLTSADHRELPLCFWDVIHNCGYGCDARASACYTYYIYPGTDYETVNWEDLDDDEIECSINILLGAVIAEVAKYDNPRVPETDFPLDSILYNSLYYPSSATDGGIIKYCNEHFTDHYERNLINSFVYADYALGDEEAQGDRYLQARLNDFRGYHILFTKELKPEDLLPQGKLYMPQSIDWDRYNTWRTIWTPFARWAVYELENFDDIERGPERFSLLFIGGEGIATYSGLYLSRGITPKAFAIIQPGHGFGFNWTDFGDPEGPMADAVRHGRTMPDYIFSGGMDGGGVQYLRWPGYHEIGIICPYRTDNYTGTVLIYKLNEE